MTESRAVRTWKAAAATFATFAVGASIVFALLHCCGCTPAGKAMLERTLLSALDWGLKVGERVVLNELDLAEKRDALTSVGE